MPIACEPCPGKTIPNLMPEPSPSDQHRAPGESSAYGREEDVLTGAYAPVTHRFVKGERNRSSRSVGVAIHRGHDFFHAQPESLRRRLDDADIGLVRDQPVDL
jgi:hypothetical protein